MKCAVVENLWLSSAAELNSAVRHLQAAGDQ